MSFARNYPDWKAPAEDGRLLTWPEPREIVADALANQKSLSSAEIIKIQNVPLAVLRRAMRQFLGHDDSQLLFAAGHQTELHHTGVWVKNALINAAANVSDGAAIHLAVDTDQPKHLQLRWPGGSRPITDDPRIAKASWSAQLAPPTPAYLANITADFQSAAKNWNYTPMLPQVLNSLRRLSLESNDLSAAITNASHELDWDLGLRHYALLASPIWMSDPFLALAHHLLARPDVFASDYNATLADYRAASGIKSPMRPMPDLFVGEAATEIPFWVDDLHSGQRTRPTVFHSDAGWVLQLIGGEEFLFDPSADAWEAADRFRKFLVATQHRLAPRALTLTLFVRLLLADQFAHGIGGGRYDQVTDQLIEAHFQIAAPKFCVTTATLYFPEALNRERICAPCVRQEGHSLRHGLLGEEKREMVAAIESLPRYSAERSAKFFEMHSALNSAAVTSEKIRDWQIRLRETQEREKREESIFDRELFYAIQPRDRLEGIIQQYADMFR